MALTNAEDAEHESASTYSCNLGDQLSIVTTQEVLVEYLNFFSGRGKRFRLKAAAVVVGILRNPFIRVASQTPESFQAGLELYRARPDKGYSLTDCVAMETMRRAGMTEALTDDQHFIQEGFQALFRK